MNYYLNEVLPTVSEKAHKSSFGFADVNISLEKKNNFNLLEMYSILFPIIDYFINIFLNIIYLYKTILRNIFYLWLKNSLH